MVGLRLAVPLVVLALALPATALYSNVTFTPIITDAKGDFPGDKFLDLTEVAVGEPGDGTLVFRISVADVTDAKIPTHQCAPSTPAGAPCAGESIAVFFDTAGGSYRAGVFSDGTPGSTNPFDSCSIDAGMIYCVAKYATFQTSIGDTVKGPYAISYEGVAQDFAPGGLYAQEDAMAQNNAANYPRGTDYKVVGSTASGSAGTAPIYQNVTTAAFKIALDQTTPLNGTYVYGWESTAASLDFAYNLTVKSGSVGLTVLDATNQTVATFNATSGMHGAKTIDPAPKGRWTIRATYAGFTGTFLVDIHAHASSPSSGTSSGTTGPTSSGTSGPTASGTTTEDGSTSGSATTSGTTSSKSPGVGLPLVLALVGLAAVAVRRRR